jgi:hypothetical protein
MGWKLVGVVPAELELKINGVNVWSQEWAVVEGEYADIEDPSYHQPFRFSVYTIKNGETAVKFAAGEFSNQVWGFYVDSERTQAKNRFSRFKRR